MTTPKRGRPRTGSLYWTKSGWRARLTLVIDGVSVQKSFNLETRDRAVARAKLKRLVNEIDPTSLPAEAARSDTFEEVALDERGAWKAGLKTWRDRWKRLEVYVFPFIGGKPPAEIRAADVLGLLKLARDGGKSRQTMIHIKGDVSAVLGALWRAEQLPENVCARVVVPEALPIVAERSTKERAVLEDEELLRYLAWQHPDENFQEATLERQVMSVLARTFGGLRTGDEHALDWTMFDVAPTPGQPEGGRFAWGYAPRRKSRRKGGKPQKLELPPITRPILQDWWERHGKPLSGPVFPVRRGERLGEHREGGSHADAFRRDLRRAFGIDELREHVTKRKNGRKLTRMRWEQIRPLTPRESILLEETDSTLPVDFHSWRRAFNQALADANVNAQQAQALAGHASLAAHERYLRNSQRMRSIPDAALPKLLVTRHVAVSALPVQKPENENEESRSGWQDLNLQQPAPKALEGSDPDSPSQPFRDTRASAAATVQRCQGQDAERPCWKAAGAEAALVAYLRAAADGLATGLGALS